MEVGGAVQEDREDAPTSKVKGVFYGLNEVKGSVQSNAPLQTYSNRASKCLVRMEDFRTLEETETYRDKDGKRKTRTRSGWRTIDSGENFQPFFLRDETGQLLVEPEGAKVDVSSTMSCICSPSDPIYYGKDRNGRLRIQLTEEGLPKVL